MYLIYSHEHGAWRGPDGRGYTQKLSEAGAYEKTRAEEICYAANHPWRAGYANMPAEVMIGWTDDEEEAGFEVQAVTGSVIAARR